MTTPLFRQEVLLSKKQHYFGSVFINTPVNYLILTGGFTSLVVVLGFFFMFASFSEKYVVRGYVNSSKGMVRVYPKKNGVIKQRMIHQGQHVKKGDPLFVVDLSPEEIQQSKHNGELSYLQHRKRVIEAEIVYKKAEIKKLKSLLEKHYLSKTAYHSQQEQITVLENNLDNVKLELIRYRQSHSYVVRSPMTGRISSVIYHQGQYVNQSKPLVKLLPDHSRLIAELFIPVRHAGFLKKNMPVVIQYDAYPAARFGSATAVIAQISESILTDDEDDKPFLMGEPYYKVTAQLDKQSVILYGKEHNIQHGMMLSGVVIGSKKKLWQWVFDPLYSYYGSVVE